MKDDLREINTSIDEGKLLFAAIALITTTIRTNKTPYEVIRELSDDAKIIFDVEENV